MSLYQKFAEDFALKAGEIILKNFSLGMKKEWKKDFSPVTETDTAINQMLIDEVKCLFPDHSVKGEEQSFENNQSEYIWVCDPVDGTIPFSHGMPLCTFSLALVHNGKSILGVVYDPFLKRLFSAEKGKGAFLNGEKIHVSNQSRFLGAVANFEMFKTAAFDIRTLVDVLMMKEGVHMLKCNSFIYPSMLVASGELLFSLFPHTTAHDVAAVKIIVEEAGGRVTDLFGNDQSYNQDIQGAIVSNGVVHEKLLDLMKNRVQKNLV